MTVRIGVTTLATCALFLLSVPLSANAQTWYVSTSKDEMTNEVSAHAHSPSTTATKPMEFPYRGVTGSLSFGCDGQDEWAYISFSESPNLTDTEAQNGGYSTFRTRVRWDDNVQTVRMSQEWGTKFLHFQNDAAAIQNMMKARTALVELDWYGSGTVYFRFTLDGSADAIERARNRCGG